MEEFVQYLLSHKCRKLYLPHMGKHLQKSTIVRKNCYLPAARIIFTGCWTLRLFLLLKFYNSLWLRCVVPYKRHFWRNKTFLWNWHYFFYLKSKPICTKISYFRKEDSKGRAFYLILLTLAVNMLSYFNI